MDRKHFYARMGGGKSLAYEIYLGTAALLGCQKSFDLVCDAGEQQFQIVHQVEKLWMKLLQPYVALHRCSGSASLKGRSVDLLVAGARHRVFAQLCDIRAPMTDAWGGVHGRIRESLPTGTEAGAPAHGRTRKRAPQASSVKGVKRVSRSK